MMRDMRLSLSAAAVAVVITAAAPMLAARTQSAPVSGSALVEQMRAAYAGKWFKTLTFVQKTTIVRSDDTRTEQTWFESLRAPDKLRIDTAPLSDGNGSLNMPDSVIVMRGGKISATRTSGNPFLPFVVGIYTQPVETSLAQMAPQHFDLGAMHSIEVQGRKIFVVGTAKPGDLTVPQFWVEAERLVVTRALLPSSGVAGSPLLDVSLENYVKAGGGWVAVKVTMSSGGKLRQMEEYTDVRADIDLPAELFDPATWMTAKHWAAGR